MGKNYLLAIGLVLIVLALVATGCDARLPGTSLPEPTTSAGIILSQQNTGIWVTGEGKVSVVPDVAILSLGVEAEAKTVAEAQRRAAEAMEAVMSELDEHGVAEKDIKTQRFSIYPRWDRDRKSIVGYQVTNMVTAKIREVDDTGIIIDAVAEAGGDYTRINSIGFTVDDPTDYDEEVREKAMDDAEAKAKQLAKLGGVSLGKPTYISEGRIFPPVPRDFFREGALPAAPAPAPTPISPGENEIQLTVQVVYSIK
jgi:uncharacterized protein YggE